MADLAARLRDAESDLWYEVGEARPALDDALESLAADKAVRRIWARDGTFWSRSPVAVADIEDRLGWLDLPQDMRLHVMRLRALAEELHYARITHVVLLGMGGSSLAPEVLGEILSGPEGLNLTVLDSTDPAQIRHVREALPLAHTLFIVSSKSGTTAETHSLYLYFRHLLIQEVGDRRWPRHFVAITDAGTPLAQLAEDEGFRALYLNPANVGGRYSALSLVGLVPGALLNIDLDALLRQGKAAAAACRRRDLATNPGILLGAILGGLARDPTHKRDKLTLLTSSELRPFGPWVEQLIAESTGKHKTGLVPVVDEALRGVADLSEDRQFVYMRLAGGGNTETDALAEALIAAGRPLAVIPLADRYAIGAAFFLWEFATAVAGYLLDINPFDQPNVEAAKKQANEALQQYEQNQALPEAKPVLEENGLALYGPDQGMKFAREYVAAFLQQSAPGCYIALMAYMERNAAHEAQLKELATVLGEHLRVPVTIGFGPRYLHSTGQLHKGGPEQALFVQITHDDAEDIPIPDHAYSFGVLKRAQALGDLRALQEMGRSILRLHLGVDVGDGLQRLARLFRSALASTAAGRGSA